MRDYIAQRIYRDPETNRIERNKVGLFIGDIYYYEEYTGDTFAEEISAPISIIHLYNGTSILVMDSFDRINKEVEKYKELTRKESFFKHN